jgi:hypothetical protein
MNTDPLRPSRGYWYPFRPVFRWPLRIVGFLGIACSIVELVQKHSVNWVMIALSLGFAVTSFQTPQHRFRTRSEARAEYLDMFLSIAIPLALAGAVLLGMWLWMK